MSQGLNTDNFDSSIRPQDDLFRHVNGPWLDSAEIQPDRATAGAFVDLLDESERIIREIIERCAEAPTSDDERKIGDLYRSFMDTGRIEELGARPLADALALVDSMESTADLARVLGALERKGTPSVIGMWIGPDRGNPDRYIAHIVQSGLSLPDESYYREEQFAEIREAYRSHVAAILTLAGFDDVAARTERIVALETELASHHWDRVACRDANKTYNLMTAAELQESLSAFDFNVWRAAAGVDAAVLNEVVVSQPSFLTGLNSLLTEDRLVEWQDWLRWKIAHSAASYLSEDFVNENFNFYGRTLSGTDEIRPRWKRALSFVEGAMGEAIGKIYVAEHFGAEAGARMGDMITNLIEAYRLSIRGLSWMSDETKSEALTKLDSFTPKIGHPREFKDYSGLETEPGDLLGNANRSMSLEVDRELAKIGKPIDRDEWYMTPQTVNAYYNPTMNEIVFPAAILQWPFFSVDADDAVNYGAIGAVIGHEIGHGFDDQGSHYDGTGALRNWWTDEDRAAFEKMTSSLFAQYSALSPEGADGQTVNGELTIGENIGDLGGLAIAHIALGLATGDSPDLMTDGLTRDQRFFLSWAQAWRGKVRPAETVRRLTVDPHSPPEFRCNQVIRNISAFHDAFETTDQDASWLEPAERVAIWS